MQYERSHNDLAKRNSSESRVLAMLDEKRREQEELIAEYELREKFLAGLEEESEAMKERVSEKREEIEVMAMDVEQLQDGLEARQKTLSDLDVGMGQVKTVVERCSSVMQLLLQSIQPAKPTLSASSKEPEESDAQRTERLLLDLVKVVEDQMNEGLPDGALDEETPAPAPPVDEWSEESR